MLRRLVPLVCTVAAAVSSQAPPPLPLPALPADAAADGGHWAFQPLATTAPAPVPDAAWDAHPVDRFVWRGLHDAGLTPAPRADRRTLLRRATFVLTGLPPTPAELAAFVAAAEHDGDDAAFVAVIDRLLASPHHAEHQARQWLDLARYSDSNGVDENLAFANAWRYRDWVVAAHEHDVPYDRFVELQLAGDLLAADASVGVDGHVATGFLALGPRLLAEQDKEKLVLDTVDEQLDLVGRTVLGLTLGCARCHDHKFDPISQRDYTALAGIFHSTRSFHALEHVSTWFDHELAPPAAVAARRALVATRDAAVAAHTAADDGALAALRRTIDDDRDRLLAAGAALARDAVLVQAENADATSLRADAATWGDATTTVLHTAGAGVQFAEWTVAIARPGPHVLLVRCAAAEARPMRLTCDGAVVAEHTLGTTTGGWLPADQRWHEVATLTLAAGERRLRLDAHGVHVPHLDALVLLPLDVPPATPEPPAANPPLAAALVHHVAAALRLGHGDPLVFPQPALRAALPAVVRTHVDELAAAAAAARAAVPAAGPAAMCVADGPVHDLPVHRRGDHTQPAATTTPRGVPAVFAALVPPPELTAGGSGRLELARWLFAPQQALPARVHANRIWQRAFGAGLVRTPSNFGVRGDAPVHAALLDWLAADLRAHGWSQRHLWRRLLTSRTWQRATTGDAALATRDPDDRLHGRQRRQRLQAEAVRDAMLLVAGTLDRTRGGSLLTTKDRDYVTNDQSADAARYDAPRRSLYLPIVRNAMYEMFTAFDYADASVHVEQRPQSVVATQALWLLNAPFVHTQARAFADRAVAVAAGDDERTAFLWHAALVRAPTAAERHAVARWLAHARNDGRGDGAWAGVAHALLASNEFLYVD